VESTSLIAGQRRPQRLHLLAPPAEGQIRHIGVQVAASGLVPFLRPGPAVRARGLLAGVPPDRLVPIIGVPGQELAVANPELLADRQLNLQLAVHV
jgi:hypothetical protein